MQCSPSHLIFFRKHRTCFKRTQLLNITSFLKIPKYRTMNKQTLWLLINQHMMSSFNCNSHDEHCWLDNMQHINTSSHVPKHPDSWNYNNYTWLTNFDILRVMIQYERFYKRFKFFGVFPIDFADSNSIGSCISKELCNLNIVPLLKHFHHFAMVFNLDKHYQSGSHWVALFINTQKSKTNYGIYYFDSNANKIPREIDIFATSIQKQINDPDFYLHVSTQRKQFKSTECGMFCIHFILKCLKNTPFHKFDHNEIHDEDVFKLRKILFRS